MNLARSRFHRLFQILGTLSLGCFLLGCAQTTRRMQGGQPLEVERGYCFVHTSYKQDGEEVSWEDATRKLARYEDSGPYVSEGNTYAIGSIVAAVASTPAVLVGASAKSGDIEMDDGASTGLLVGGVVVGIGGIVLCVISDGKYATAGEVYNERVTRTKRVQDDDRAYERPETDDPERPTTEDF